MTRLSNSFQLLNSIGLFDKKSECLYLIRDFAGIKPLFYGFDDKNLVSSETNPNLSQLLLPALNLQLDNAEALKLLGHEGYQLK